MAEVASWDASRSLRSRCRKKRQREVDGTAAAYENELAHVLPQINDVAFGIADYSEKSVVLRYRSVADFGQVRPPPKAWLMNVLRRDGC